MRCEQCQVRPATIRLNVEVNQQHQQLHLCETCFAEISHQLKSPSGGSSFHNLPSFDDLFKGLMGQPSMSASGPAAKGPQVKTQEGGSGGILHQVARNLTATARAGLIDPVIGRDREVERVVEILNRRNKNNPVLIGEPGVGKTAIAEGLALRIVEGKAPRKLLDKELYLLDVASLVADTGIRGQFEERMKQLMAEVQQNAKVILVIDEIHLLVGAGSAQGSMDAGNILKPALARGELQVIGATTLKEYRQIEQDAALERRFQPVMVNEPSIDEAVQILQGIRSKYEDYHHVKFSPEAVRACVTLSHRYIQDRYLPDKAIDLLDEAGSKVNLSQFDDSGQGLESRLERVIRDKNAATQREDYEAAAKLRDEEITLRKQLDGQKDREQPVITPEHIAQIVEGKTGIPVQKLQRDEQSKMRDLEGHLSAKVIGQQEAVQKVAKAIRRSRAGLKAKNRPIGSFLFVGPTGVGKTELAKRLAEELFGDSDSMIRLDMSEYMEKHSVSKIIGSPPGYVGHDEAGQLTERIRRHPYSILLLDEIEKAHGDVQHMFLQILEDGRLTDSQGRTVSFKDTVIIMTSNAGVTEKKVTVGFGQDAEADATSHLLQSLQGFFKPEFLNRFDSIVEFGTLSQGQLVKIVDLMLEDVQENLEEQNIRLEVTDAVKVKLTQLGYHPSFGARPLRRVIQEQIEDRIADTLLEAESVASLTVDLEGDQITVTSR